MKSIGIFGGSFDPIHFGHLRPALEILEALSLDAIHFVPSGQPPHRALPVAPAPLRLAMVKAALAGEPRFVVDEREILRPAPSYTVDTLEEIRGEYPHDRLLLLAGMDAFLGFPGWHEWQRIFTLAHVVVAQRPGWVQQVSGVLAEELRQREVARPEDLHSVPVGKILLQPVTQLEISSSRVRALAAAGRDLRYLVPEAVHRILLEQPCYSRPLEL
ncbi:MAG: nicotinate-nucleotide adenylyltransferase [Gammaproteobacteria bacterium]